MGAVQRTPVAVVLHRDLHPRPAVKPAPAHHQAGRVWFGGWRAVKTGLDRVAVRGGTLAPVGRMKGRGRLVGRRLHPVTGPHQVTGLTRHVGRRLRRQLAGFVVKLWGERRGRPGGNSYHGHALGYGRGHEHAGHHVLAGIVVLERA